MRTRNMIWALNMGTSGLTLRPPASVEHPQNGLPRVKGAKMELWLACLIACMEWEYKPLIYRASGADVLTAMEADYPASAAA